MNRINKNLNKTCSNINKQCKVGIFPSQSATHGTLKPSLNILKRSAGWSRGSSGVSEITGKKREIIADLANKYFS
jgi:hypothetical protein